MYVLQATDLKKYYGKGEATTKALDGVTLSIQGGEFIAVVGTSGSGKSTLLNMMGGLDVPTSGSVQVAGKELSRLTPDELTIFRRRQIGFVFQNYNLVPTLNVYENIVLPVNLDGKQPDKSYINGILTMLHLEQKIHQLPNTLSGGQQQRVAIARALANKPAILLADEPTGNLDSKTSIEVMELIRNCGQQLGQTIVMITHDDALAQMAERVIRIEDGRIQEAAQAVYVRTEG